MCPVNFFRNEGFCGSRIINLCAVVWLDLFLSTQSVNFHENISKIYGLERSAVSTKLRQSIFGNEEALQFTISNPLPNLYFLSCRSELVFLNLGLPDSLGRGYGFVYCLGFWQVSSSLHVSHLMTV